MNPQTKEESAEVFNAIMSVSAQCKMIYGVNCQTIQKVVQFWGELGSVELERIEDEKYEPRMPSPAFPIYDDSGNIIG